MSAEPETCRADWTLGRLLSRTTEFLAGRGVEEARLAAEVLLAHTAECKRVHLYTRFDEVLPPDQLDRFRASVRRAANHEPIAYLVGEKEFFSLAMVVTPDVLIPRPETETVVECALDHIHRTGLSRPRVLDFGTGCGCIAVAMLTQLAEATVVATDVSAAALAVALRNAERHGVSDRLIPLEADGLPLPADAVVGGGFDLLISNPPYVARGAMEGMDRNVRDYEPRVALTDESDGLSFYRAIAAHGPAMLTPNGCAIVEVGDGQASAVVDTMTRTGGFTHVATRKDRSIGAGRALLFSVGEPPC